MGDAACAFDPLASAGIVAGLRSGLEAAGALARHVAGAGARDGAALAGYDKRVQRRFIDDLNGRREQYSLEAHWPDSPSCRRQEDAKRATTDSVG